MNTRSKKIRLASGLVVVLTGAALTQVSSATGVISKADLAGPWQMTLTGNTGCGLSTSVVSGTLNNLGTGLVTLSSHTTGCGNLATTERFTIETLSADGSGTAGLTCNNQNSCGWTFRIQVSPDRSIFNLVDISDPGNFLEGVAIHQ